jgi:hypothetical protein
MPKVLIIFSLPKLLAKRLKILILFNFCQLKEIGEECYRAYKAYSGKKTWSYFAYNLGKRKLYVFSFL